MTLPNDLNFALLALDSYSRGYNPRIDVGGSLIGDALAIARQDVGIDDPKYVEWQTANFYAVAYQTPGGIVISYRGTDSPLADALTGWPTVGGLLGSQAQMAAEFYYKVKEAYPSATITLTGHSPGGELAGIISQEAKGVSRSRRGILRMPIHSPDQRIPKNASPLVGGQSPRSNRA